MSAGIIAGWTLGVAAVPVAVATAYLLLLTLASRRRPTPRYAAPRYRFDLVVPAHDEEAGIAATVASLSASDYPAALRRVIVVADNCADQTAARARAAGALVLERRDTERRGKGYALAHAFERSLAEGVADAVVVVDADTVVTPNLLSALAAQIDAGADAVQTRYAVRNVDASWRTRLMAIAFALFNEVRSLGRMRLGLSVGLRGNGMCFTTSLLRAVPHDAFSIVEDLEYGITLGRAGHRVAYAADATVLSDMVTTAAASGSQRQRWEGGRARLARALGLPLLRQALAARSVLLLDLAIDLLVPPLATLAGIAVLGTALAAAAQVWLGQPGVVLALWSAILGGLVVYVGRGWVVSGTGWRGLVGMLRAPVYVGWKIALALRSRRSTQEWIRTHREGANDASPPAT